ncbi:MAG: hypothetical protein QOI98_3547, partial [Solirubrobacteraceae bacterium]|nr:hypothetical protein [Solirubrobacteraceae bacterium]
MTKVVALALAAWFVLLATADAKLVFQRAGSKAIVVARNDGSHRHVIAHGFAPVVSPDGKWVSFFRWHRFGDSLHVVDTAGGKSRKLSGGALAMEPMPAVWSPDSQLLLASNGRDSALLFNIERRTKHGYGLRDDQLAGGAFSPDATRLVLAYGGSSREDAT